MTRKLTPNGKRKLLAIRVSEPVYAAMNSARGAMDLPDWVRDAVYAALAAKGLMPDEGPVPGVPAPHPVPAKRARKTPRKRGGYEAGDTKVSDLPPPPASMTVPARGRRPRADISPSADPPMDYLAPPVVTPPPARALPARAPGTAVFLEPDGETVATSMPPAPAVQRKKCTHPGYRRIGGFCPDCNHPSEGGDTALWKVIPGHCPECDRLAEPGGYWQE